MEDSKPHVAIHQARDTVSGRIITNLNTEVYLDEKLSALRHGDPETCPHNVMFASIDGLAVFLHCQEPDEPRVLSLPFETNPAGQVPAGPVVPTTEANRFTVVGDILLKGSRFGLIANNTFVCAEPDGRITLSRAVCDAWELFRLKAVEPFDLSLIDLSIGLLGGERFAEPGFPFDYYREGVVDFDENGVPFVPGGMKIAISDRPADGDDPLTVVISDLQFISHYFHFVEVLFVLFSIHMEMFPHSKIGRLIFGAQKWRGNPKNNVQQQLLTAIYRDVEIVDTVSDSMKMIVQRNILVLDRMRAPSRINKFMEAFQDTVRKWMPEIRRRVFERAGISERDHIRPDGIHCSYSVRQPTRTLTAPVKRQLFDMIRSTVGEVMEVNFADMTWLEQVRYTANVDLLIGIHGNGLTNLLWLPRHAVIIEIFPSGAHVYDYQMMAEIAGLTYFGIEASEAGHVYREWNRFGSVNGQVNKVLDYLPRDAMLRILKVATAKLMQHKG